MIALAATLHDAAGALAGDVGRLAEALRSLYPGGVAVTTSPPTAVAIVEQLAAAGMHAGTPEANERGPLYRRCVRAAIRSGASHVHYLDFDRALHWAATQPEEFRRVLRLAETHDVLLVGRTERAHRSHHRPLHATETIANRLMADRLGWSGRVDGLVPSFAMDAARAERLVRASRVRGDAVYGEWLALVVASAPRIAYVECRGLEWETPDRDPTGVAEAGLDAWRDRWDTPEEWARRSRLAERIVRAFERTLSGRVVRPPELARLAVRTGAPSRADR